MLFICFITRIFCTICRLEYPFKLYELKCDVTFMNDVQKIPMIFVRVVLWCAHSVQYKCIVFSC